MPQTPNRDTFGLPRIEDLIDSPPGVSFRIQRGVTLFVLKKICGLPEDADGIKLYSTERDIGRLSRLPRRKDRTPVNTIYSHAMIDIHQIVEDGKKQVLKEKRKPRVESDVSISYPEKNSDEFRYTGTIRNRYGRPIGVEVWVYDRQSAGWPRLEVLGVVRRSNREDGYFSHSPREMPSK